MAVLLLATFHCLVLPSFAFIAIFALRMGIHFHSDKELYFQMQRENAAEFVLPFVEKVMPLTAQTRVLEIGCAEGGVLLAFLERGCQGVGVELSEPRAQQAMAFLKDYIAQGQAQVISKNIYDEAFETEFKGQFDLIVLKDVIEHIHDQAKLMRFMKTYLRPGGQIFFGFPPWQMPFGGHQQIAVSKLGKTPWLHLLPRFMYRGILKMLGESQPTIDELMDVYTTGISLERFERIVGKTGYRISNKLLYLINPIYKYKFKLKPRKQIGLIAILPWFRNYYTTCGYYLITPNDAR
jgi:SAM-dependent methyltransferase